MVKGKPAKKHIIVANNDAINLFIWKFLKNKMRKNTTTKENCRERFKYAKGLNKMRINRIKNKISNGSLYLFKKINDTNKVKIKNALTAG